LGELSVGLNNPAKKIDGEPSFAGSPRHFLTPFRLKKTKQNKGLTSKMTTAQNQVIVNSHNLAVEQKECGLGQYVGAEKRIYVRRQ
jgi:hypothetical protein